MTCTYEAKSRKEAGARHHVCEFHLQKLKLCNFLSLSLIRPLLSQQYFEIGKPVGCCGPELVWKIHDAYRKNDGKVNNIISLQYLSAQHRRLSSSSFIYSTIPSQLVKSSAHNFPTMNGIFHPREAAHDSNRSIIVFLSFLLVELLSLRPSTAHLTCC